MKTVFFGPFIGEFGWELLFWQGWVRKVCKDTFKEYRKIAASVPGRQPFYPYVDEFWPIPESFLKLRVSCHGYYTDGWRGGYPGTQHQVYTLRSAVKSIGRLRRPSHIEVERPIDSLDVEPQAEAMLAEFKQRLPEDTVYFVPWKANRFEPDKLEFGLQIQDGVNPTSDMDVIKKIDFQHQLLEYLEPTTKGEHNFRQIIRDKRKLVAVFPRFRAIRRSDKNWSREKYVQLIELLQSTWPDHVIAILGEPGGTYFADGVPSGCLDLINVPAEYRMDIQVAALKQCSIALGSMSGAVLVALAAGCPTLIWGFADQQARYYHENFMGTPMIYYAYVDPSVNSVFELLKDFRKMLRGWSEGWSDNPG